MRSVVSCLGLLMLAAQPALARGWRGGSGQMVLWWEAILIAVGLIVLVAVWKNHPGRILLAIAIAVIARELFVNWG